MPDETFSYHKKYSWIDQFRFGMQATRSVTGNREKRYRLASVELFLEAIANPAHRLYVISARAELFP